MRKTHIRTMTYKKSMVQYS